MLACFLVFNLCQLYFDETSWQQHRSSSERSEAMSKKRIDDTAAAPQLLQLNCVLLK